MTDAIAGLRILIVEDEAIIAMMAEDMLLELGGDVVGIETSLAAALARAGTGDFDIALLDMNLNGENSLPVAEKLRALGRPFVFTTGYGDAGRPGGFDRAPLVCKPYRTSDLAQAIIAAMAGQPAG
ncbi:response regulator [Sphingomonas changnyeongensis]|uniref:Response regulator n=2 Tax=Sphingomonas changnyeongensis TaxID=2698679 RepID=A0A7Z2S8X8_9SPHN|nr:response regulator [Sphingomonas changnyeongensis]